MGIPPKRPDMPAIVPFEPETEPVEHTPEQPEKGDPTSRKDISPPLPDIREEFVPDLEEGEEETPPKNKKKKKKKDNPRTPDPRVTRIVH